MKPRSGGRSISALARIGLIGLVIASTSCGLSPRLFRGPSPDRLEPEVFTRVNSYRRSRRLPALTFDGQLRTLARRRSRNMAATNGPLSHAGLEAQVESFGRRYRWAGENAESNRGFKDPAAAAVEHWISSPEHRRILEGDFDRTGVGAARSANGTYYFSQIFLKER